MISYRHSIFTQFPKERNYEVCKRTKVTRTLCRRRTRNRVPRAEKFGDLITADHKVFSEDRVSSNNQWYAVVIQDLTSQRMQSYPCKTKSFQETLKSLRKFLNPTFKSKSHLYWQFIDIWPSMWRVILESLGIYVSSFQDKWYCWTSSTQNKGRNVCCIVAIRLGRKMMIEFHEMLLLSAKHSRSIVGQEDILWTTIWRTFSDQWLSIIRFLSNVSQDSANL